MIFAYVSGASVMKSSFCFPPRALAFGAGAEAWPGRAESGSAAATPAMVVVFKKSRRPNRAPSFSFISLSL